MPRRLVTALVVLGLTAAAVFATTQNRTLPGPDGDAKSATGAVDGSGVAARALPAWRASDGALQDWLAEHARVLATSPFAADELPLPQELRDLDYEGHRGIRFREEASLWRGQGRFEVQLFHPGSVQDDVVRIHVVEDDTARLLPYDPELFSFEGPAVGARDVASEQVGGFAGFRVLYPLNRPDGLDEVVAFLGASYFRMLGAGHRYGVSSRGLAIDPAVDGPEEFPAFRAYWLERPAPGDRTLVFHALLDGPSVTGAYRFELAPGSPTVLDVEARVFARRDVRKLGVAPMSSMFLHAPGRGPASDDFRPRVHDSDGLLMRTGSGEWIWRPLGNGPGLHVTSLHDGAPRGFGLVQRERRFDRYLDLEARYDLRPSQWIEVLGGDWGAGGVELLEIPTTSEFNDNIAAYWVPDRPLRAGEERTFRYRIRTFDDAHPEQDVARVERSLVAWNALPGQSDPPPRTSRRVVVDFVGGALADLPPDAPVSADLSVLRGEASELVVQPLPGDIGRRVTFALAPDGEHPADMRLFLESGGTVVTETWSYVWYPESVRPYE